MAESGPNMYTQGERVTPIDIEVEMKGCYIDYAMSVIVGRALPDVRDGLKPVHRRILYAMHDLGLTHDKPHKKSARIVGEVLGKYHPHGDVAVYDTLVRMVQDFSLRYPLVDGQGNFGSVDGDNAAAMRYSESRLAAIADELLADLDKNTVDFAPNFDESLQEPVVLPARLPNLLVNGASGIAVGMATNIPPHNLREIGEAVIQVIDNPQITLKELMKTVKGPDFPTGGIICGLEGIRSAFETGRGSIRIRAKAGVEPLKGNREAIIVTEIPYQVNKSTLIEAIAGLVENKKIEGISDLRDESDKDGMRIVIELKRDQNAQIVLNQLYSHSQLQETFGVNMLALAGGTPKLMSLKEAIQHFIRHREDVVTRRTRFELERAERRAHILEGLKIAVANIDKIIKLIRASKSPEEAKLELMVQFKLTEVQAKAILELQLQRLTQLERHKIDEEYAELIKKIELLRSILRSRDKVLGFVKEETREIIKKYGDERRTQIIEAVEDLKMEDLIVEEDVVITISHGGYIKRLPVTAYRRQRRGGKGVTSGDVKEEDFVEHLFVASTHEYILFFTDKGKAYWLKVHEVPPASRQARGRALINVLTLGADEKITSMLPVKSFDPDKFLVMATKLGVIKKVRLDAFSNPRKGGIIAIGLQPKDELIEAVITDGRKEIVLATRQGLALRCKEKTVREMGRAARGVRGIRLGKNDWVVSMLIADERDTVLSVTERGFGKRTKIAEYRLTNRGGKGVINMKTKDKSGPVVDSKSVTDEDELMIITQKGMMVRCPIRDIRTMGRSTQGVKVIRLNEGDKVVSVARVHAQVDDEGGE